MRRAAILTLIALATISLAVSAAPSIFHPIIPVITSHSATAAVSVDENTTAVTTLTYTPVGATLSVSGADASLFTVNSIPDDGRLAFLSARDYETPADAGANNVYNVTVTATYEGRTDSTDFAITVVNVDEGTPGGDVTAPTISTKTINAAGTTLTLGFSENVTSSSGLSLSASGGPASLVYATGSGTSTYTYTISRSIKIGETVTLSASSSNIVDGATNTLANFSGSSVTNNSTQVAGTGTSLRPAVFPSIPSEPGAAGFTQNDLSTSVRTNVAKTSRAATVTIAGGTYTAPYTASTADRTIQLTGDVTYDGAGIIIAASNVTVDLNGHTLTYMNVDMEDEQVGTVVSKGGGDGTNRPTLVCSGVSNGGLVIKFIDGPEAGNWYDVYSGSAPNLTLENNTVSSDASSVIRSWQSGGPVAGNTFRIFDPRKTFGVGTLPGAYSKSGCEIVNGYIVQGAFASSGRGYNVFYNAGASPVFTAQGQTGWMVGGVSCSWSSANTGGIMCGPTTVTLQYNEVNDLGTFLSNRQRAVPAISVGASSSVHHNRIINHRHLGVEVSGNSCTVEYNEIYGDSRATNAYGVGTYGKQGNTFRYNNIYKVGEHPICLALHSNPCQNNNVHNNWCEAKSTRSSSEYGWNYAVAISNRWDNGARTLANSIHDNTLITYSEDGPGANEESRGRTVFFGGLSTTYGEVVEDNFIWAYNTDDSTECHAIGLSAHNNKVVFRGNIIGSSHNPFWFGDTYGACSSGGRFIDNDVRKSGSDPGFATFMLWDYYACNVDMIGTTFGTGTAEDDIDLLANAGNPAAQRINFGDTLTVTVTESAVPVSAASVTVKDTALNTLRSGYTTNGSGVIDVDVPSHYRARPGFGSTTLNPLTVQATKSASSGSNTISPTGDDTITVTISP